MAGFEISLAPTGRGSYFDERYPFATTRDLYEAMTAHAGERYPDKHRVPLMAGVLMKWQGKTLKDFVGFLPFVAFDLDKGDATFEEYLEALGGLEFFVHTTFTHSEDVPKLRVYVSLDRAPRNAVEWRAVRTLVAQQLPGTVDPETEDLVRSYYWPVNGAQCHFGAGEALEVPELEDEPETVTQEAPPPGQRRGGQRDVSAVVAKLQGRLQKGNEAHVRERLAKAVRCIEALSIGTSWADDRGGDTNDTIKEGLWFLAYYAIDVDLTAWLEGESAGASCEATCLTASTRYTCETLVTKYHNTRPAALAMRATVEREKRERKRGGGDQRMKGFEGPNGGATE